MSANVHTADSPFSSGEIEVFHAEDRKAATAIIGLMAAIFVIGICLYSIVCYGIMS